MRCALVKTGQSAGGSGTPGSLCVSGSITGSGSCICNGSTSDAGVFGNCLSSSDCCSSSYNYVCDLQTGSPTINMCLISGAQAGTHNPACYGDYECISGSCNTTSHTCSCVGNGNYCTGDTDCCSAHPHCMSNACST
jgi:hypothetical protein